MDEDKKDQNNNNFCYHEEVKNDVHKEEPQAVGNPSPNYTSETQPQEPITTEVSGGDSHQEYNKEIYSPASSVDPVKGFEIITESLVTKIYDIMGKNGLLSVLYQVGIDPGRKIAKRIKEKHDNQELEILDALKVLATELHTFYSIQLKSVETTDIEVKLTIENHCFLRQPIKHRPNLHFGSKFCRVNKGYFETALKLIIGSKIKKVEMKFIKNDEEKDVCIEELIFTLNPPPQPQ